jgi:D-erythro-7,8-dihydroneopterin triphosphate epimerase
MALIRIKNLMISTFIGFNPEELVNKQNVKINMEIDIDVSPDALSTDEPVGIYDYKTITKSVIALVEKGRFKLLEVLTRRILDLILGDPRVKWARVEVDKPQALRFAESVSFVMEASQGESDG